MPPLPSRQIVNASPTAPKARITNVVASGSDATRREASPWDRWPRWNSDDITSSQGAVAATFQQSPAATPGMVPVTYSAAVVARNTPQRDTGPEAEVAGRTHIVVDGDSLEKLAERYLDDPTLDDEIYRLNRDVLASPELLPIGVELQIPDDRMAAAEVSRTASNMVPVERMPRPFEGPPRAELLPPIPAGQND
jgi:nucleoid-associated protein YgaU